MKDQIQKTDVSIKPKIRIVKTIIKDKNGNIVGEHKYDNNKH